jgi:hypothetical protein
MHLDSTYRSNRMELPFDRQVHGNPRNSTDYEHPLAPINGSATICQGESADLSAFVRSNPLDFLEPRGTNVADVWIMYNTPKVPSIV